MNVKTVLIYTTLILYLILSLFPFVWLVNTSFKTADEVLSPTFFGSFTPVLENYKAVLTEDRLLERVGNSLLLSLATVIITIPIGSLAGYAFARMKIRRKNDWFFIFLTTRMAPPVAFGVPFYLLLTQAKLLDTFIGMLAVYTFMNLAFCIWLSRSFFEEIPVEIEEAALVDGCGRFKTFIRITLPLAVSGIITTAILIFILTWNEFFFASILTRNNMTTYTVHLTSYFGSTRIEWGELAAASTIVSLIAIVFAFLIHKYIVRGFSLGIVKGEK